METDQMRRLVIAFVVCCVCATQGATSDKEWDVVDEVSGESLMKMQLATEHFVARGLKLEGYYVVLGKRNGVYIVLFRDIRLKTKQDSSFVPNSTIGVEFNEEGTQVVNSYVGR
jgi:hypothetical protein